MGLLLATKQSSHQTKRNKKKLTSSGFKQQPICIPLPQQETKSSTKQLAPPQSFIEIKTLRFCNPDTKNFKNEPEHTPKNGARLAVPFLGTACTASLSLSLSGVKGGPALAAHAELSN